MSASAFFGKSPHFSETRLARSANELGAKEMATNQPSSLALPRARGPGTATSREGRCHTCCADPSDATDQLPLTLWPSLSAPALMQYNRHLPEKAGAQASFKTEPCLAINMDRATIDQSEGQTSTDRLSPGSPVPAISRSNTTPASMKYCSSQQKHATSPKKHATSNLMLVPITLHRACPWPDAACLVEVAALQAHP